MARNKDEVKLIEACIESYERMIKYHRKQILDLKRKLMVEPELESFNMEIIKK